MAAATPLLPLPGTPSDRREIRRDMGVTIKDAASELGVSARTYLRWEHGAKPSLENQRKYGDQIRAWRRATAKIVAY
jgi:DNA-binding XRE family transcriptional regulator